MEAITGDDELLEAGNDGIAPIPLVANPIVGFEFIQVYVVPATELLKAMTEVFIPLQNSLSTKPKVLGVGLTVIVKVFIAPRQPKLFEGVTDIVAVTEVVSVFVAVKIGILPLLLAAKPILGLLFVHENVVPIIELEKAMAL